MDTVVKKIFIRDFFILYQKLQSLQLPGFSPYLTKLNNFLSTLSKQEIDVVALCLLNNDLVNYLREPKEFFYFSLEEYENLLQYLVYLEQFTDHLGQNIRVYTTNNEMSENKSDLSGILLLYQEIIRFLQSNKSAQRQIEMVQRKLGFQNAIVTLVENGELNKTLGTVGEEYLDMSKVLINAVNSPLFIGDAVGQYPTNLGRDYDLFPFVHRVGCPQEGCLASSHWKPLKSEMVFYEKSHTRFCLYSRDKDLFEISRTKPIEKPQRHLYHFFLFYLIQPRDKFNMTLTPKYCFFVIVKNEDYVIIRGTREIFLEDCVLFSGSQMAFLGRA